MTDTDIVMKETKNLKQRWLTLAFSGEKRERPKHIFVCFCSFVIVTLNNTAQNSKFSKNLPSTWQQTVKEEKKMNAKWKVKPPT